MKQDGRILEWDLMKSFIIIVPMIGIHVMYDLTTLSAEDGALESVINILATQFSAPMFMFCMGATIRFSHQSSVRNFFLRGIHLLTVGMILNVLRYLPTAYSAAKAGEENILCGWAQIFNVDILQFAGLVFMFVALLWKLNIHHGGILVIAIIMNIVGTLLDGCHTDSYVVNQLLGYFYPTPTCCCFPLMNWFIFVAAGNMMSWIYQNRDIEKFLRVAASVGAVITVVYLYLCLVVEAPFTRALQSDWGYYSMHTPDALFTTFGIAPFMLGVFRLLTKVIPQKWNRVLHYPSRRITQYYCISWIWIMWTAHLFLFIPKATTIVGFILFWVVIVLLTTITVHVYRHYLQVALDAFFSRHAAVWTIGIWIVLILFGTWYFSFVPGPYTMPY